MNKVHKITPIYVFVAVTLFFTVLCSCKKDPAKSKYYITVEKNIRTNFTGSFNRCFNDKNDCHLEVADKNGITPLTSVSQLDEKRDKLCKISTCSYYKLDSLTHSHPYLVPRARDLLDNIGHSFCDSLKNRGGGSYRIVVTSLLRVDDDIKKLRRRNVNAIENSAHSYGTTFDITYRRFDAADPGFVISEDALRNLLAEVLYNLREEGLCYVKYEVKQGCFHITAR